MILKKQCAELLYLLPVSIKWPWIVVVKANIDGQALKNKYKNGGGKKNENRKTQGISNRKKMKKEMKQMLWVLWVVVKKGVYILK